MTPKPARPSQSGLAGTQHHTTAHLKEPAMETTARPHRTGMSRADYETVAAVIHDAENGLGPRGRHDLALDMAEALCAGSTAFDPVRFVQMVDTRITRDEVVEWSHALRLRVEALEYKRATRRN